MKAPETTVIVEKIGTYDQIVATRYTVLTVLNPNLSRNLSGISAP